MDDTRLLEEIQRTDAELKAVFDRELKAMERRMTDLEVRGNRPGYSLGMDSAGAETKAMASWLRGEQKSITPLSVTSDGLGVTARSDWSNRIFELVRETTPMRQVANVEITNRESWEGLVDTGQPDAAWVAETATRTETQASFLSRHKITPHELYAYPTTTLALLEDSEFIVEEWLQRKVAERFSRIENDAFVNGNGDGKPRGILSYARAPVSEWEWGSDPDEYIVPTLFTTGGLDSAEEIHIDDVFDVVDSLEAPFLNGARFLMNRATRNTLRKLKDSDGRYFYQLSLGERLPDTLLGYPVTLAEDLPGPGDGEPCILFGNFREAYTIVQRQGVTVQRDALTRPGFVRWYVRARTGGALTNPQAVRCLQIGSYVT